MVSSRKGSWAGQLKWFGLVVAVVMGWSGGVLMGQEGGATGPATGEAQTAPAPEQGPRGASGGQGGTGMLDNLIPPKPVIDAKSEEVLKKMSAFYAGGKGYSFVAQAKMMVESAGQSRTEQVKLEGDLMKPDKFRVMAETPTEKELLVTEGKTLVLFDPAYAQYMEMPVPAGEVMHHPILQLLMRGVLFEDDPYAALQPMISTVNYAGTEKIGDAECDHLKVTGPEGDMDWWIEQGSEPWLRKIVADHSKVVSRQYPGTKMVATYDYPKWKAVKSFEEGHFQFKAPEGVSQVDQFLEEDQVVMLARPAPTFELKNLAGETVNLDTYLGKKVIILDFWASWCQPCVIGMPIVDGVAEAYKDKDVVLFAINAGEEVETVKTFLKDKESTGTVLLDSDGMVSNEYKVSGIPQLVLIGKDGTIQVLQTGFDPSTFKEKLTKQVEALVNGKKLIAKPVTLKQAVKEEQKSEEAKPAGSDEGGKTEGEMKKEEGAGASDTGGATSVAPKEKPGD